MEILYAFMIVAAVLAGMVLVLTPGKNLSEKISSLIRFIKEKKQAHDDPDDDSEFTESDTAAEHAEQITVPLTKVYPVRTSVSVSSCSVPDTLERCYSARIRVVEDGVPFYCFIPVRGGFSAKKAGAAAVLSSCLFSSDRRARYLADENGKKRHIPLTKQISIPVTVYLAPVPNASGRRKKELLIRSNSENVWFQVRRLNAGSESDDSGKETEYLLDPENSYEIAVSDHTDVAAKEYTFRISFCNDISGHDYNTISAFMPD